LGPDDSIIEEFEFHEGVLKIGKLASSHLRIEAEKVSRMHAIIEQIEHDWQMIDLGSIHGTFVNGERIAKIVLKGGDMIKFGDVSFEVTQITY
jgi:pSer/pThr/pTyr-binding forkhead associated (FHA) protein